MSKASIRTGGDVATADMRRRMASRIVSRREAVAALVLVAVLLLALVAAVWVSARDHVTDSRIAANRISLREQAGGIVDDVFSVDAAHWQDDRARARRLVAAGFAGTFGAQLQRGPAEGTASVRWQSGTVALASVGRDSGTTLIPVVVHTRAAAGAESAENHTVRADLELRDDQWLLTGLEVLT